MSTESEVATRRPDSHGTAAEAVPPADAPEGAERQNSIRSATPTEKQKLPEPAAAAHKLPATPWALRNAPSDTLPQTAAFVSSGADQLLAVAGQDKMVTLHCLHDPEKRVVVVRRKYGINGLAVSCDGAALAIGDTGGWVGIIKVSQVLVEQAGVTQQLIAPFCECEASSGAQTISFTGPADEWLAVLRKSGGVEIRDARGMGRMPLLTTLAFQRSPAHAGSGLSCVGGSLIAAASGGWNNPLNDKPISREVRVWKLDESSALGVSICELSLAADANAVALRPSDKAQSYVAQLAVGMGDGVVLIMEDLVAGGRERGRLENPGNTSPVVALEYSPDGSMLVTGCYNGVVRVYDIDMAVVVAQFTESSCAGTLVSWAPANDVVAMLGSNECVTLRSVGTTLPCQTLTMTKALHPDVGEDSPLSVTGVEISPDGIVALVSGSCLEVTDQDAKLLVNVDLGAPIGCYYFWTNPVRMGSDGEKLYAGCALDLGTTVTVRDLWNEGRESFVLKPSAKVVNFRWSPDGRYIAVAAASAGFFLYDNTGQELRAFSEENTAGTACAFNSASTMLVTGGYDKRITIRSTSNWEVMHRLPVESGAICNVCLDAESKRVAYHLRGADSGSVVVYNLEADDYEQRFPSCNAAGAMSFSHDGKFLAVGGIPIFPGKPFTLLSLERGKEVLPELHRMPFPRGDLCGVSVGFVPTTVAPSSTLYAAVGHRVTLIEINILMRAIEDNVWKVDKLIELSTNDPETVRTVIDAAPHLLNIRDPESGDTVLHQLTREREVERIAELLQTCTVAPIPNSSRTSQLGVAIEMQDKRAARLLWRRLPQPLTHVSLPLVVQDLRKMARKIPELVLPFLLGVENNVLRTVTTFRSAAPLHREEVCCFNTNSLPLEPHEPLQVFMPAVPTVWRKYLPDAKSGSSVLLASKVLLLPHFVGELDQSPFHDIVKHCDALVFQSKLMRLAVRYKWKRNVWPVMRLQMAVYCCALVLATVATVLSSRLEADRGEMGFVHHSTSTKRLVSAGSHDRITTWATALVVAMTATEGLTLCNEAHQLVRMGRKQYLGPWNVIDSMSSIALLLAAASHFSCSADRHWCTEFSLIRDGVEAFGAVGIGLKWIGAVYYLRCWSKTGSLVRMLTVILHDMKPFLLLLASTLLASVSFLMVAEPESEKFGLDTMAHRGLLWPLVTVYMAMVGSFEVEDFHGVSVLLLVIFLFLVVIVLLNLLIAIMGDSYEKVKEREAVAALRERAIMIMEMEVQHPTWHRFCTYMHIIEAADEDSKDEPEWQGITGRTKQLLDATNARVEAISSRLERLEHLSSRVEDEMGTVVAKVDDVALRMDEMVALMKVLAKGGHREALDR